MQTKTLAIIDKKSVNNTWTAVKTIICKIPKIYFYNTVFIRKMKTVSSVSEKLEMCLV